MLVDASALGPFQTGYSLYSVNLSALVCTIRSSAGVATQWVPSSADALIGRVLGFVLPAQASEAC